jgi:hypothetical protein
MDGDSSGFLYFALNHILFRNLSGYLCPSSDTDAMMMANKK